MTLGQTIRYLRQARGLSQTALAKAAGVSASYLSLVETDKREASIPLLRSLADKLGTPVFLFFAQALAGQRQDPLARQAESLLEELATLVAARGLPLELESSEKA